MGTPGMQGDVSAETSAAGKSGLLQLLRTDRQCAQALTRRGKYRIAEGGGNQWHRGFADAAGRLVAVHEMHVEFGQFVVAQQPIIIEVGLLHSAAYDSHVAPQGGGETEDDAAVDLRFDDAWIDHLTAVDDTNDFMHLELAADDGNLRHLRHVSRITLHQRHALIAARGRLAPAGPFGSELQHSLLARLLG